MERAAGGCMCSPYRTEPEPNRGIICPEDNIFITAVSDLRKMHATVTAARRAGQKTVINC
jgi:hypothetical protein